MANDDGDDASTRMRLHRAAAAAAAASHPPALKALMARANRRRRRITAASVAVAAAALIGAPAALVAMNGGSSRVPAAAPPPSSSVTSGAVSAFPTARPGASTGPGSAPGNGLRHVKIWLLRDAAGQACPDVVAVDRQVEPADGVAKQALRALLDGPTDQERARGFTSAFEQDAGKFRYLKLSGTSARADFTDLAVIASDDACAKVKILEPMQRTLEQFSWITEARFSIRGDQTAFYVGLLHEHGPP